jgi:two-component system chemotaxis sensor kinase CheA
VDVTRYAELFLTETQEQLLTINEALMRLERDDDAGAVDALFRAVHTIKGMSATMGYTAVADLSHETEALLALLRAGTLRVSGEIVELLFRATDQLEVAIELAVAGRHGEASVGAIVDELSACCVRGMASRADAAAEPFEVLPDMAAFAELVDGPGTETAPAGMAGTVVVRVRVSSEAPLRGVRAFLAVQKAGTLGVVGSVTPPLESLQTGEFADWFSLHLTTALGRDEVARVVGGVGDIDSVEVFPAPPAAPPSVIAAVAPPAPTPTPTPTPAPPQPAPVADERASRRTTNVRIELKRLDALMNLIGELVIARGRLTQVAGELGDAALDEVAADAARLITALQTEIVTSRMVPVGQVFDRFPRLVRDAARALDKQVEFVMEGREIELDRSMLDELGEPLVHLLRNAVDHGIEQADVRVEAGKPASGRLTLSASRDRSSVVVAVRDDGRGIDRARVLRRAIAAGLVDEAVTELGDDELFRLVSLPGFSTADQVSEISGRGVGVDAVQGRVRAIGGAIEMSSRPGEGTCVTLRLPLTLAIVRALVARVGEERYALPLTHVRETVAVDEEMLATVRGREVLLLRDEVFPVVRLRDAVGLPRGDADTAEAVVVEAGGRRAAVIVDECAGQQEVVVKQFDAVRGALTIFGGATILGDGAPALIVDAASLLQRD